MFCLIHSNLVRDNHLRLLPTNQRIKPTTKTIKIIAVQKPALKIPPITSHELTVIASAIIQSHNVEYCFMSLFFYNHAKVLPQRRLCWKATGAD